MADVPRATRRPRRPLSSGPVNRGADMTAEEWAFCQAIERFKKDQRRPFPTWREVLGILKGLGYRKPDEPAP